MFTAGQIQYYDLGFRSSLALDKPDSLPAEYQQGKLTSPSTKESPVIWEFQHLYHSQASILEIHEK